MLKVKQASSWKYCRILVFWAESLRGLTPENIGFKTATTAQSRPHGITHTDQ